MQITQFCIKRPITTLMCYLGIVLFGVISWNRLPRELLPPLTYPQITVLTTYEGAAPKEIESMITRPIEEAIGTVNKVKRVSSISKEGTSIVMAEFDWDTDLDLASLEVREKIDLIKEKLPREAKEPIVMKYNPFDTPIMKINLIGDLSPLKLRKIAKKNIKEELEKLEGVANVELTGGLEREILVEVDAAHLRAASLSILDVTESLKRGNINYPAGSIKQPFFEFLVRTLGEFKTVSEIKLLPVKAEYPLSEREKKLRERFPPEEEEVEYPQSERLILLEDIAEVKDTTKERKSISRYQNKESITLSVRRQSQANVVKVVDTIRKELDEIKKTLPPNVDLKITYDQAKFIKESLSNVRDVAWQGGILAFITIFFFLRNLWFSSVVIISIPLSILAVITLMYLCKISLNIVSLGGLALGVGMLVDNTIVVLESIFVNPHQEIEKKIVSGTQEVTSAIFGSTLTTICVFFPMIFVKGIAGQLFKQLAFSIIFSLSVSLIVALTLVPVLVNIISKRKLLFQEKQKEITLKKWEKLFSLFFRYRIIILATIFFLFIIAVNIFLNLDRELLPRVDYHEFILKVDCQPGTPLEETDKVVRKIESVLFSLPQVKEVSVTIGSASEKPEEKAIQSQEEYQAQIFVKVDKKTPTQEVIDILKEKLEYLKNKKVSLIFLAQESFLKEAFARQAPLVIEIKGDNIDNLKKIGLELKKRLKKLPYLYNIKLDYPLPRPEIKVKAIKDKLALYSLNADLVSKTLNTSIKGSVPTKFKEKGEEFDIRVRLKKEDRNDIEKLKNLLIHGYFQDKRIDVPLKEVADIKKGFGPTQITRIDQERTITLSSSIYKTPLSKVIKEIKEIIQKIKLPSGYKIEIGGEAKRMRESFTSLKFALILSIIMVYMVMASEFESLTQPFLILFVLPLSLIGVTLIQLSTRAPLNIISYLGLIMMGGIVVNNGIVLVDYTNFLRRQKNIPLEESIKLASMRRIRPILMTSLTTILGLIPLSLGIGGAQLMQPLGIVTIGGLASATFLTPVILPLLYYYFEKFSLLLRKEKPKEEKQKIEKVEVSPKQKLNLRHEKLIEYLKKNKKITRSEYAKIFNISVSTAARDLKFLSQLGIIEGKGPLGPGRYYVLKSK